MPRSQVDEQVVKMSFDNSNFDGNINDSINALNKLDNKLLALNRENFSSLNNSLNNLTNTFSVKGQIMFGVLSNLGKDIYGLGKDIKNYLFKGIKDGIGEYNTIIDSTEAIYQNVKQNGNSLKDVNNALDELNDYADKTIYNFGQMTRMIGMFSSAGVGLKSSVSTIKGLANSAALVGANMQKAQIAWNAVSRAMSSGRFTNITWRSLELSGIAGKQFNKVITEVARTMKVKGKQTGKDIDGMIKKWGSLRESLREGWLTKDVFTQAMDIMSGALSDADLKRKGYTEKQIKELRSIANAAEEAATKVKTFKQLMDTIGEAIGSGWAQSFRILIGDLEEAKKLYTRISNVISDFIDNNANIRNELFKKIINGEDNGVKGGWKSGRDNFRQIIENMMAIVKTFLKSVKTAFYNIFPIDRIAAASRKVLDVVQKFTRAFTLNTSIIQDDGQELWNTSDIEAVTDAIKDLIRFFRGLASAADIAWMAISQPIKVITKRIPFFNNFYENTNKGLIGIIKKLGEFGDKITAFRDVAKDWEIFGYVIEYLLDNIDELGKKYPVLGAVLWVFNGLKKAIRGLKDAFNSLNIKPLSAAFGLFKMVVTSIWKILNGIFTVLKSAKNSIDWSWLEGPKKAIINFLKTLSDYGRGLLSFEQATGKISGVIGNIFSKLNNIFSRDKTLNKVKTVTHEIEKQYSKLNVTVDKTGKKVQSVWDKIKGFFSPVSEFFKTIGNNGEMTFEGIAKKIGLIGGGVAAAGFGISHLVKTFKKISILENVNNLLISGIDVIKAYQKEAQSKMILNIAIAIGILAASMAALSFIPYDKLENGLVIFSSFMAVLSMTLTPIIGAISKFNNSLDGLISGINTKLGPLGVFGIKIAKGLNARMFGKAAKDIGIAIAIIVASIIALKLVFKNPKDIEVPVNTIIKLIKALTQAIAALVVVMGIMSKFGPKIGSSVTVFSSFLKLAGVSKIILSLSAAVFVLVGAMYVLSKMEIDKIQIGFNIIMAFITFLSVVSATIAGITSNANNFNKLKKISISISGAVLAVVAISAAFALLVKYINQDQTGSWWKALIVVGAIMVAFTTMAGLLIKAATKITDMMVFKKLGSLALIMTSSILAIAGGLYLLSYANPIPASVVVTIGIMTAAIVSLLSLMAIVTAKAKGDFSTKFVKVIEGISISISAIVLAFGVLIAAVAALVAAFNSVDISTGDANKASNTIISKVTYIAETISKSLPALKKLFYSIGQSVGTVFTSFTTGFINQVISVGETYNQVAEKFVNLIIDLLGKVVGILKSRKDDIAKIIGDVVDFLGTEITAAVNAFFKKNGGEGLVKEEDILRWLGLAGIGTAVIAILAKFNTLILAAKNLWSVIVVIVGAIKTFTKIKYVVELIDAIKGAIPIIVAAIGIIVGGISLIVGLLQQLGLAQEKVDAKFAEYNSKWEAFRKNALNMRFIFQSFIYGFGEIGSAAGGAIVGITKFGAAIVKTVFRPLISLGSLVITLVIQIVNIVSYLVEKVVGLFNKNAAKSIENFRVNTLGKLGDSFLEVSENMLTGIKKDWQGVIGEFKLQSAQSYNYGREIYGNYAKGGVDALDGAGDDLSKKMSDANKELITSSKGDLKEASPSKVSYDIYWNYILGAEDALSEGGKRIVAIMKSNNTKLIKETINGTSEMNGQITQGLTAAYDKVGAKLAKREGLHQYKVGYNSYDENGKATYKEVQLNRELTEAIIEQKDALVGKSKEEAAAYINQQAIILGVKNNVEETAKLMGYIYDSQMDKTKGAWNGILALEKATEYSWGNIMSAEEQASMEALSRQMETNRLLADLTNDLSDKIVGKKKEEAAEIIKQDLMQKGMTEQQAEEESKKMIALIISQQKNKTKITQDGLNDAIKIMQAETDAYEASVKEQTEILNKELDKQLKLKSNAASWQEKAMKGDVDKSNYREYVNAQREYIQQKDKVNGLKNELNKIVEAATKRMNDYGLININQFNKDYENAYKQIDISNKKSKSIKDALSNFWKDVTGKIPSAPDLTTWKLPTSDNGNGLKDDGGKKSAVDAARDLKKDLEKERADLTPTFDLDKLASDANKANGIVMSSLMAAQNASIGDYINKDSELNPFMKDRWQNVYNFTQNNYSPKALSRIDIYRQTQRQLGMSRGF